MRIERARKAMQRRMDMTSMGESPLRSRRVPFKSRMLMKQFMQKS